MNHLSTSITVGHANDAILLFCKRNQFFSLFSCKAKRLFTDGMQTGFERGLQDLVMRKVGSRDRDRLNAVRALSFLGKHGLVIGVAALGGNAPVDAEFPAALLVHIERTRAQRE